jgi:DNA-binding GntR family transcriptional regulator
MALQSDKPFHASNIQTLAMAVQREIERQILTGELKAGARLSESAMAERLGVSRGPVREAMRGLKEAGLVDIIANKGVVVRKIGLEEALDLYDLRSAVFGLACATLARRRSRAQCRSLQENLKRMQEACHEGDKDAYYRLNVEFHAHILDFCGNRRAKSVYEGVVKEMHLFRRRGLSRVPNIEASLREHEAILDAVMAGDAEAAQAAGRAHVLNGKARFTGTLDAAMEDAPAGTRKRSAAAG